MDKGLRYIVKEFSDNETLLNRIIVSLFVRINGINVQNNALIKSLLLDYEQLSRYSKLPIDKFKFDELIETFELAIPVGEKVINGAVYTPGYIKTFIIEQSIKKVPVPVGSVLASDISCGCGAFLFTLANIINQNTGKLFQAIYKENIFGLDISPSSIKRTEILLTLLALSKGEDVDNFEFNLYTANALNFDWGTVEKVNTNNGFDLIVGNPPYVRAKNIDEASKNLLAKWAVTKSGNPDLYIPFFQIGLESLNERGILGYITVNSFFKSVNARELRNYLNNHKYDFTIIDFGHEKIFGGKSAYTCICLLSKAKSETIAYKRESSKTLNKNGTKLTTLIRYNELDHKRGWLLSDNLVIRNIKKIESTGEPLGKRYLIKNGIATLSNDVYIFRPVAENKGYYTLHDGENSFEIEKGICRDIIKPNILKDENEIELIQEKLIYPYTNGVSPLSLIDEKLFQKKFPKAYHYLLSHRERLAERDKGNGGYDAWYAFGRTQALNEKGYKLMFPYMDKEPHFVFTDNKEMLIYCGYAIYSESIKELKLLKKILQSSVFSYYISNTSKPYSAGYFSYAKNYVKYFGVCNLSKEEEELLLNINDKRDVDQFLIDKYDIVF